MRDGIIKSFSFFVFLFFIGSGFAATVGAQTDSSGELGYATGRSVQQTSDGGYIITGETLPLNSDTYDVFLIKTDSNGKQEWSRTFGEPGVDVGCSVQQTSDGGYIITGGTQPSGTSASDVLLIKTDSNGKAVWSKNFGGPGVDVGYSVQQTSDGGYIITGGTQPDYSTSKFSFTWLLKTDSNGNNLWFKPFSGPDDPGIYAAW